MSLTNLTPFPSVAWENNDHHGTEYLSAVTRVKFKINFDENGVGQLQAEQNQGELFGENISYYDAHELRYPTDFIPFKPYCDVILNVFTHAPIHTHHQSWECGVCIVDPTRRRNIHEKRLGIMSAFQYEKTKWFKQWKYSFVNSCSSLPIRYRYAYGGEAKGIDKDGNEYYLFRDEHNPLGTGILDKQLNGPINAPQITHANGYNSKNIAGFGAIHPSWESRFCYSGTYDEVWLKNHNPLLPHDFNPLFYQSANPDMIVKQYLVGGEVIQLFSLHPLYETLAIEIPKMSFVLRQELRTSIDEYVMAIDTVLIETTDDGEWFMYVSWRKRVEIDEEIFRNILFLKNNFVQS